VIIRILKKNHLATHRQTNHEGMWLIGDKCGYEDTQEMYLTTHKKSKHKKVQF